MYPPPPSMKLCVSGLREKADIGTDEGFLAATKELVRHKKNFFLQSLMSVLFSVIFSVHGLKYIENKLFLFVPSGKISGACGWVQFPLATVFGGLHCTAGMSKNSFTDAAMEKETQLP